MPSISTGIFKPHSTRSASSSKQGSLVYHCQISLKEDLGPIKLHGRSFTTSLSWLLKKNFRKLLWIRKASKRGGWGSGLHFYITMTLGEYNIPLKQILRNKIQKLHKAAKCLHCNWDFMNKIEVKIVHTPIPVKISWMIDI